MGADLADPSWDELLESAPVFVDDHDLERLLHDLAVAGTLSFVFDLAETGHFDVNRVLKDEGWIPSWTGPGWDALWDVIDEVREAWDAPVLLVVRHVDLLAEHEPWRTLNLTTNLSLFAKDLSALGSAVVPLLTLARR